MRQLLRRFHSHDRGEGLAEYALLIALIAIVLIGIMQVTRNAVGSSLNTASAGVRTSSAAYGSGVSPRVVPGGYGGQTTPQESPDQEAGDSSTADSVEVNAYQSAR